MVIGQPLATDLLNAPDHSASHRIIANDPAAPVKTIQVSAAGNTSIGDSTPTNYTNFGANGRITLNGTARVEKNLNLDIDGLAAGGAAPAINRTGNYYGYSFNIADDGYIKSFEIPYDCDLSLAIELKIHWFIDEAYGLGNGEIKWGIHYTACKEDATEAVDGVSSDLDTGDINIPATAKFLTGNTITFPGGTFEAHDVLAINVERLALTAGADPVADPVIVSLEIEYIANSLGLAT